MKNDILAIIRNKSRLEGIRTTEIYLFLEELDTDDRDAVKDAILELIDDGDIKCVTEKEFEDYCWLVPAEWEDRTTPGYYHIPKKECEVFGL